MRLHHPAELGQVRLVALAVEQQPAQLLLEQLDRAGQRGLGDVALLGRAREVERLAQRHEVADLVHFHRRRSRHGCPDDDLHHRTARNGDSRRRIEIVRSRHFCAGPRRASSRNRSTRPEEARHGPRQTLPTAAPIAARPLAGKGAIVTGSTSGIGLGIARALAARRRRRRAQRLRRRGGRSPACATSWRSELGVTVAHSGADMSRPEQIAAMVAEAAATLGAVDILVNNAGIQHVAPIESFPPAKWDAILAINLSAAFHTMRAAIPGDEGARLGPDHQRRLGARPGRLAVQVGLRRRQARHGRPDQGRGARARRARRHLQRRSARAMSGRRWSRSRSTTRRSRTASPREQVIRDVLLDEPAQQALRHRRGDGRADRVPVLAGRRLDHRHRAAGRRRLDRALTRPGSGSEPMDATTIDRSRLSAPAERGP